LNGLLFTREDATSIVNERRTIAKAPADLSGLDAISMQMGKGPCIKQFSDSDFFINEWLENEKRKREEERQRRKLAKANRKKGKIKRKQNKTIKKLKRKHYDHQGNVINDADEEDVVAVTTYQLTDDNNRNFDALMKTNKKSKSKVKKNKNLDDEKSSQTEIKKINSPPVPPPNPEMVSGNASSSPPPAPNPMNLRLDSGHSERIQHKLRSLSDDIPIDHVSTPPDNAASPRTIYAQSYQNRNLDDESLGLHNTSEIISTTPKQVPPVPPKLGFLGDIAAFKDNGKKLKRVEVKRNPRPKDKRTNILDQIRGNKVKLSAVSDRKMEPKKEEKKNLIFEAMKHRRDFVGDSSSEEDSEWGSDSD